MKTAALALAAVTALSATAFGQAMNGMGGGHDSPSSQAYMAGMDKMSKDMGASMTGDADEDFALMMIPHHQGAIDMAKVELQYGKDPTLREMAQNVIKAQEGEIAELNAWLAKNK